MELAQGDVQRFPVVIGRAAALVKFDGHQCPGGRVAKLVCHCRSQLSQGAELLVAANIVFIPAQLQGHLVYRQGQVADFVVAACNGQGLEISLCNGRGLIAKPMNRTHKSVRQDCGDQNHGDHGDRARHEPG